MLPEFIKNPDPEIYLGNDYIVLDIETTNLDKGDAVNERNDLVYGYYHSRVHGSGDIRSLQDLKDLEPRLQKTSFVVAQGAKFELKWLLRAGIDISRILIYDTLLGDYVIAGNRKFSLDLDSISRRYGGVGKASLVSKLIAYGICPSVIPDSLLRAYCRQDVRETERVLLAQRKVLKDSGLLPVFFLRCLTTPVLADIEMNGLFLDKQEVLNVYKEYLAEHGKLVQQLNGITGGINMASPQQVASFLYTELGFDELRDKRGNPIRGKANKRFPQGQPLTDEDTILALRPKNEKQRLFLSAKLGEAKIRKKITGYCERYLWACGHEFEFLSGKEKTFKGVKGSCLIHGTLNQTVAHTHRLTSSNPNLQNIDRKLKKLVCARRKGWKIRSADYKTLEFTVAGILTQDAQIKKDIENEFDVHTFTAKTLTENGQPSVRDQATKAHTFKPLYGGSSGTKAERAYYKVFQEKYSTCYKVQKSWVETVLKTKMLRIMSGLIFYWPDTKVTDTGYITNTQNIFNYPVQSFATADLAPTGVCLLWHELKARNMKAFIINEVHDSVLVEEPQEESELVGNLVEKCMSKDLPEFVGRIIGKEIDFPLRTEQKVGRHWDSED